jgi:hypothetical protein
VCEFEVRTSILNDVGGGWAPHGFGQPLRSADPFMGHQVLILGVLYGAGLCCDFGDVPPTLFSVPVLFETKTN